MASFQEAKYILNIKPCTTNLDIKKKYEEFSTHHLGDSGIDLYIINELIVESFKVGTIDFEIQCEMYDLETNTLCSYYLVPRSSIANTDFQLVNSIGIIDAGYRGNIKAKIRNFNPTESSILNPFSSYFQIISPDLKPIKVNIVDELTNTTRGTGGFGSTNR